MNVTPKTMAQQVRKAEEVRNSVTKDVRRLAYTSTTGDAPRSAPVDPSPVGGYDDEAHCFVCGRHTDHWGEHDDLVEAGKARYEDNGSVYPV